MPQVHIRHSLTGAIIHSVDVDKPRQLFPADLRGLDLSNVDLTGADLPGALLDGANLLGARLMEADLRRARMRGCDLRYSDLTGADLTDADLTGAEVYPANTSKKTKLFGARIDPDSELAAMSQAITTARRRRSGEPDGFDLHLTQKAVESLLDPNTKKLQRTVSRERRGWNPLSENAVLKAKMRVLRYTREIELNRERLARDLRFLRKKGIDLSFIGKLTNENEIG
jgi:uncharacterized protein YjbI with pentapeptide repeats